MNTVDRTQKPLNSPPVENGGASRAQVELDYVADGQSVYLSAVGWARVRSGWLDFMADDRVTWSTYPPHTVTTIEWLP